MRESSSIQIHLDPRFDHGIDLLEVDEWCSDPNTFDLAGSIQSMPPDGVAGATDFNPKSPNSGQGSQEVRSL